MLRLPLLRSKSLHHATIASSVIWGRANSVEFSTYPTPRHSIGGRLANFIFCNGEHLTALSESYLCELAEAAGFTDIRRMLPCRESGLVGREVLDLEYENDFINPHTVIIEARKPR